VLFLVEIKFGLQLVQFLFQYILGVEFSELAIEVVLHLINLMVQLNSEFQWCKFNGIAIINLCLQIEKLVFQKENVKKLIE